MSKILIIGAGGVGQVVTHKCAHAAEVFSEVTLASRNEDKCHRIASQIERPIATAQVDADSVPQLVTLIERVQPELVVNVALPYQDLTIMDACLETAVHYLDTANYEPPNEARFEYSWQWAYQERFRDRGLTALLGSGFDPGVTNVFCAYVQKHLLDEIHEVEIIDANAGDHGHPFATNFNPEINIREVTAPGKYWQAGKWTTTDPLAVSETFAFPDPEVGSRKVYLMYHEELESLARHLKGLRRIRFWMTFSESYLEHLRVLQNVGMTSIEPVLHEGREVIPLQFLKSVLPDPASLGPRTQGKTCIGCVCTGIKKGDAKRYYIYNICDHQEAFRDTGSQAVSYTTGVPAAVGAEMLVTGKWLQPGVWNMEQLDPDPFLARLGESGLPWQVREMDPSRPLFE